MSKKLYALVLFLLLAASAFAQNFGSDRRVSILGKPFVYMGAYFVNGMLSPTVSGNFMLPLDVELYFKLSDKLNFFVNPNAWLIRSATNDTFDYTVNIIAGVVLRPGGGGLTGFYCMFNGIAGWSKYTDINRTYYYIDPPPDTSGDVDSGESYPVSTFTETRERQTYLNLGAMIEAGYTWVFNKGFTLMLGGGIVQVFPIALGNYTAVSPFTLFIYGVPGWPVQTRMRVSIGYSF
jgi:hypothetical protein